jgi:ADP-heptose:LPS heptosyltransferase
MNKPNHYLLIRFSSLGDIVLQTSMCKFLKHNDPGCKISFLVSSEFSLVLEGEECIDEVISFDRKKNKKFGDYLKFLKGLKTDHSFTHIIDLHVNLRTFILKKYFRLPKTYKIKKYNILRRLFVLTKYPFLEKLEPTQIERNIKNMASELGFSIKNFDYPLTSLAANYSDTTSPLKNEYIVLCPVASFHLKRWPILYYRELAELILKETEYSVIVLGGPSDDYVSRMNFLKENYELRFHNFQGDLNLLDAQRYLKHARFVVGNDSGLNHMAEALNVNVFTIFGPTHEDFGFRPHLHDSRSISQNLWCRPCSTKGNTPCLREVQYCMYNIKPDTVYEKLKVYL